MIRFLSGDQLNAHPILKSSMHRDRAIQFFERLRWNVTVDKEGEEHDEYDALNPLYIILEDREGLHAGSLRFLPTTGQTMVNDHFLHLTDGVSIMSPHIWECTRFCVSPSAERRAAAKLLAAGAFLMKECSVDHFVGVFDQRMERIYNAIGAVPNVLGRQSESSGTIGIGLWEFHEAQFQQLLSNARLTLLELSWYFDAFESTLLPTHHGTAPISEAVLTMR